MGSKQRREIGSDLQTLRDDVSKLADTFTGLLTDKGEQMSDEMKNRVQRLRDDIDDAFSQATAKGGELVEAADMQGLRESIESSVRERPLTMLAIAAGIGAAVGMQLRR